MDITWLDIWKFHGAALLAGCVIDWIIGDPIWLPHPVRLMGTMIAGTESRLRKWTEGTGRKGQSRAGVILAVFMCIIWWCVPWAIVHGAEHLWLSGAWAVLLLAEGFLCSLMLAARGLYTESMKVCRSLEEGSTEEARYNVSMIVGRDTAALDEGGIARAAVETVAENASDGVIAPFLFMALLGPAGGTLYKAVNTMDSMVGYKNDKYLYFGRCAAKLDDVVNYIPARISAWLMILASACERMNWKNAEKIYKRDRYCHASPNSAQTEAVMAGALEVQLAGDAVYFGKVVKKPTIGDDIRPVEAEDIKRANHLMYLTSFLGLVFFAGIRALFLFL